MNKNKTIPVRIKTTPKKQSWYNVPNFKTKMLFIDHEVELVHLKLEANGVDDFHEDSLAQVCFELPFALPYKLEDHEYE
jgi:hypothetical protein